MGTISSTELNRKAASYVSRAEGGESFDITVRGEVVARLSPVTDKPVSLPPAAWEPSPSAGTAGSPIAADGRRHWRDFPCPSGLRYRLSEDGHIWLLDYPPVNLKAAEKILSVAFPPAEAVLMTNDPAERLLSDLTDLWNNDPADPTGREALDLVDAALAAANPITRLPQGTRLILAAENLLDTFGTRTEDGDLITAEWGKASPEGWYEPTFTVHYGDNLKDAERRATVERIRAAMDALPPDRAQFWRVRMDAILDAERDR